MTSRVSACLSQTWHCYESLKPHQVFPIVSLLTNWALAHREAANKWVESNILALRRPPKCRWLCPKWAKALDWTWTQLTYIPQDWGINRKGGATVKCSLSGDLQANHSCYNRLLFPSYLLPTTNSQRQEIERKRDIVSLENRTKDRALITKTWNTSPAFSISNLRWILNIQLKLTHSEIKINTLLFWFLYMLNLLL